jgi:hypothetical protein
MFQALFISQAVVVVVNWQMEHLLQLLVVLVVVVR